MTTKRIYEWPCRPAVIVKGGSFQAESKLPDCLTCGQDELWVSPLNGVIRCYVCDSLIDVVPEELHHDQ